MARPIYGLSGFNNEKGLHVLDEWCYFCSFKECVTGMHWLSEPMPIISKW